MTFEFPLRARCIEGNSFWRRGEEVRVLRIIGAGMCAVETDRCEAISKASRFKPIIRRVAGSVRT